MHTSDALTQDTFTIAIDGSPATVADLLPGFDRSDRIGVVVGSPHGLVGASLLVLAGVFAFYELQRERGEDFWIYPDFFAFHVGRLHGHHGALDLWPPHKEVLVAAGRDRAAPGDQRPRHHPPARRGRRGRSRAAGGRGRGERHGAAAVGVRVLAAGPGGARRRPDRRGRHDRGLRRRRPAPAARPGAAAGGRGLRCRPRAHRGGPASRARRHRRGAPIPPARGEHDRALSPDRRLRRRSRR